MFGEDEFGWASVATGGVRKSLLTRSGTVSSGSPLLQTLPIPIGPLTEHLEIRLRRPTTLIPLSTWDATSTMQVGIVVTVDGVEHRAMGRATGGIRQGGPTNGEIPEYVLQYAPSWGFFGGPTAPAQRLGQTAAMSYTAHVELTLLSGSGATTELAVESTEAPAPMVAYHSSVAFDAATGAVESSGDGVLSLTHTPSGSSNLGAFGAVSYDVFPTIRSTSCSYGGTNMTEVWDANLPASDVANTAGYHWPGGATLPSGAQSVVSTLAGSPSDNHFLHVLTMTEVHQTTPVGTPVTGSGSTSPATVTVGSVGADDLVVDSVYCIDQTPTAGADQTQRSNQAGVFGAVSKASSQLGSAGGVMSWTFTNTLWNLGAIAFKPAAAGGDVYSGRGIGRGIARGVMR